MPAHATPRTGTLENVASAAIPGRIRMSGGCGGRRPPPSARLCAGRPLRTRVAHRVPQPRRSDATPLPRQDGGHPGVRCIERGGSSAAVEHRSRTASPLRCRRSVTSLAGAQRVCARAPAWARSASGARRVGASHAIRHALGRHVSAFAQVASRVASTHPADAFRRVRRAIEKSCTSEPSPLLSSGPEHPK